MSLASMLRGVAFLAALLIPTPALADKNVADVEKCFSAYEQTQIELKDNNYTKAIEQAARCSSGCPDEINEQCQGWARQAERDVPTVLLFARHEDGKDAPGITAFVDGKPRALQEEIALDPGPHRFEFRGPDGFAETLEVKVIRGEKRRTIRATVPEPRGSPVEPVIDAPRNHTARNWTIVSFSVGGVGIGVASIATIVALSQKKDLDGCAPACPPEDVDRVKSTLRIADIGAIVGAVGITTGVAILIWGNPRETQRSSAILGIEPLSGGAGGVLRGSF